MAVKCRRPHLPKGSYVGFPHFVLALALARGARRARGSGSEVTFEKLPESSSSSSPPGSPSGGRDGSTPLPSQGCTFPSFWGSVAGLGGGEAGPDHHPSWALPAAVTVPSAALPGLHTRGARSGLTLGRSGRLARRNRLHRRARPRPRSLPPGVALWSASSSPDPFTTPDSAILGPPCSLGHPERRHSSATPSPQPGER